MSYITVKEYAKREGIKFQSAQARMYHGRVKSKKVNGVRLIAVADILPEPASTNGVANYEVVLADLRRKRTVIDAAIGGLEALTEG